MTKKDNIKIIRGSGFKSLDGSLVSVISMGDDGRSTVVPYGIECVPISIDSRCLQDVDIDKTFSYTFEILKYNSDGSGYEEQKFYKIEKALRDVPLNTIIEYLETHLKPILKLE